MAKKKQSRLIDERLKATSNMRKYDLKSLADKNKQTLAKQIMKDLERKYNSVNLSFEIKK